MENMDQTTDESTENKSNIINEQMVDYKSEFIQEDIVSDIGTPSITSYTIPISYHNNMFDMAANYQPKVQSNVYYPGGETNYSFVSNSFPVQNDPYVTPVFYDNNSNNSNYATIDSRNPIENVANGQYFSSTPTPTVVECSSNSSRSNQV